MADLVSLFFRRPQSTTITQTIQGKNPPPLMLDATIKETYEGKAEVTQHPVEKGADVSDNIIIRPCGLTISGIITESPFQGLPSFLKSLGTGIGASVGSSLGAFGPVAGAAGAVAGVALTGAILGADGSKDLGFAASAIRAIRDAKLVVDIQTGLLLYRSYALASFRVSRDQKSGRSIMVDLEFTEVILAESAVSTVAIPKLPSALSKANLGKQAAGTLNDAQGSRGASLLKKGASFLGGG